MKFFTSDTHFGHKLMVQHRGFKDRDEMDQTLVDAINAKVSKSDLLFHLGDFSLCNKDRQKEIRKQIKCTQIFLVYGNHDGLRGKNLDKSLFQTVDYYNETKVIKENGDKVTICMSHYPMESWNKKHYGSWMLHGHCHGNLDSPYNPGLRFDVGVDTRPDFAPYSETELEQIFKHLQFHPGNDHHT